MKKANIAEWVGMVLCIFSLVITFLEDYIPEALPSIMKDYMFWFWLGLLIWALGYLFRTEREKKQQP